MHRSHWYRNAVGGELHATRGAACKSIAGAHRSSYVLTTKDAGHAVSVRVTVENAAGGATATSKARAVPAAAKKRR